jgi:hypothetical protein
MMTRTRRVTQPQRKIMTAPEEAVKKLTRLVDQLSCDVVLGRNNWETVVVSAVRALSALSSIVCDGTTMLVLYLY